MSILKNLLSSGIDKTLGAIKGVVTTFVADKGLQQQINAEIEKHLYELKLKELDYAEKAIQAEVADRASARNMYNESIRSNDKFVRRFPMYLAGSIFAVTSIILVGLLFLAIPEGNRDILNISLGSLVGGGVVAVINFYFGSSYEKKHKD